MIKFGCHPYDKEMHAQVQYTITTRKLGCHPCDKDVHAQVQHTITMRKLDCHPFDRVKDEHIQKQYTKRNEKAWLPFLWQRWACTWSPPARPLPALMISFKYFFLNNREIYIISPFQGYFLPQQGCHFQNPCTVCEITSSLFWLILACCSAV